MHGHRKCRGNVHMLLNVHGLIVNVEEESFLALARKFLCVSCLLFTPILQHVVGPEIFFFTRHGVGSPGHFYKTAFNFSSICFNKL